VGAAADDDEYCNEGELETEKLEVLDEAGLEGPLGGRVVGAAPFATLLLLLLIVCVDEETVDVPFFCGVVEAALADGADDA